MRLALVVMAIVYVVLMGCIIFKATRPLNQAWEAALCFGAAAAGLLGIAIWALAFAGLVVWLAVVVLYLVSWIWMTMILISSDPTEASRKAVDLATDYGLAPIWLVTTLCPLLLDVVWRGWRHPAK